MPSVFHCWPMWRSARSQSWSPSGSLHGTSVWCCWILTIPLCPIPRRSHRRSSSGGRRRWSGRASGSWWCPTAERAAGCRIFAKNGIFHGSAMRESPTRRALRKAMERVNETPEHTAMAGDQSLYGYSWCEPGGCSHRRFRPIPWISSNPFQRIRYGDRAATDCRGPEKTKKIALYPPQHLKLRHK